MAIVRRFLDRFVLRRIGQVLAADKVRAASKLFDGRVLHLADGGLPWTRVVVDEMPEVLLVVYPEPSSGQHQLRTVPQTHGSFASRIDLPQAWSGLREGQLAQAIGVPDAVFCHTNLFIAGARSLEGALTMARMALDNVGISGEQIDRTEDLYRKRDSERLRAQFETGDLRAGVGKIITEDESGIALRIESPDVRESDCG